MAANSQFSGANELTKLNLAPMEDDSERGLKFWNKTAVQMKFGVERQWVKSVRFCDKKPNYGMQNLDPVLEELTGNKLELVGPMLDGFLKEIGTLILSKLARSRMTGLMAPISLFMPYSIFKHVWVLISGYGGDVHTSKDGLKISLIVNKYQTAEKVWSPARFSGENFLLKRNFEKIPENGRMVYHYKGKATVVITNNTPLKIDYSVKQQKAVVTFYVQRYDKDDFAVDAGLQNLMIY